MLIRDQLETESTGHVWSCFDRFKIGSHDCGDLISPKSAGRAGRLETQGKLQFESKGYLLAEFFLAWGESGFVPLMPSTDLMWPTLTTRLICLKSTSLNVKC